MRYAYTRCVAPARASRPSLPVDESLPTWGQVRGKLFRLETRPKKVVEESIQAKDDEEDGEDGAAAAPEAAAPEAAAPELPPTPAPPAAPAASGDLAKLTVKELKALLKEKGKAVSGKKAELVARLMDNYANA